MTIVCFFRNEGAKVVLFKQLTKSLLKILDNVENLPLGYLLTILDCFLTIIA